MSGVACCLTPLSLRLLARSGYSDGSQNEGRYMDAPIAWTTLNLRVSCLHGHHPWTLGMRPLVTASAVSCDPKHNAVACTTRPPGRYIAPSAVSVGRGLPERH